MRRFGLGLGAAILFAGVVIVSGRRFTRVAVSGHSMEPGLRAGDWLLIDRTETVFVPTDVVVARDPRERRRLIVKRVRDVDTDFQLWLASDHPAHVDEVIGPVDPAHVLGLARLRYWPLARVAVIGSGSGRAPDGRSAGEAVSLGRQSEERSVDQ